MDNGVLQILFTVVCGVLDAALIALAIIYTTYKRRHALQKERYLSSYTFKLILSAVFIGLALVLKKYSVSVPLFGAENGMRVGLTGVFSSFPALLCGPLFGGLASAILDIMGCIINPSGAYNPVFTLTAFMAGTIRGFLWLFVRKAKKKVLMAVSLVLVLIVGIFGAVNYVNLANDGLIKGVVSTTEDMPGKWELYTYTEVEKEGKITKKTADPIDEYNGKELSFTGKMLRDMCVSKGEKNFPGTMATYANLLTIVLVTASLIGVLFLVLSRILSPLVFKDRENNFLFIFVTILLTELIQTTINTEALILMYGISVPFVLYLIPRVTESILVCIIQGYLISVLYGVYSKMPSRMRSKLEY